MYFHYNQPDLLLRAICAGSSTTSRGVSICWLLLTLQMEDMLATTMPNAQLQ